MKVHTVNTSLHDTGQKQKQFFLQRITVQQGQLKCFLKRNAQEQFK